MHNSGVGVCVCVICNKCNKKYTCCCVYNTNTLVLVKL
jgi:hypothetical protein